MKTLDQEVVTLLQAGDGLYDGSDQPDLVVLDFSRDESSSQWIAKICCFKILNHN